MLVVLNGNCRSLKHRESMKHLVGDYYEWDGNILETNEFKAKDMYRALTDIGSLVCDLINSDFTPTEEFITYAKYHNNKPIENGMWYEVLLCILEDRPCVDMDVLYSYKKALFAYVSHSRFINHVPNTIVANYPNIMDIIDRMADEVGATNSKYVLGFLNSLLESASQQVVHAFNENCHDGKYLSALIKPRDYNE